MTPLESRKQLLLVESELNRVQLMNELRDFKIEVHQLKQQMEAIGSLASSAAKLTGTLSSIGDFFARRAENKKSKSSWISNLLNAARTGASIWDNLRSHRK
jgi:hypothetical protein